MSERSTDRASGPLSRAPRERVGERATSPTPSPAPTTPTPHSRGLNASIKSKELALELRRGSSMPERILWNKLRAGRCYGVKFRRQHPLGECVADFYCVDAGLDVELDGAAHDLQRERDRRRDAWIASHGVEVLRIPAGNLSRDADHVVEYIMRVVERRMEELHPGLFAHRKAEFLEKREAKPRQRASETVARAAGLEHRGTEKRKKK